MISNTTFNTNIGRIYLFNSIDCIESALLQVVERYFLMPDIFSTPQEQSPKLKGLQFYINDINVEPHKDFTKDFTVKISYDTHGIRQVNPKFADFIFGKEKK